MRFTDIFIKRPVLSSVISLLILLLGARSLTLLNVREYPETSNAVISINTPYVGADAELVKGFVTTPLEKEVGGVDGIDYLESSSIQGLSSIKAHLRLDYDPYKALTQVTAKVNKVKNELPEASENPIIDVQVGETTASMYMSFFSNVLKNNQVTDYLVRVVQPKLQGISGIQSAEVLGARTFAMRIWLKPDKMASLGLTPADVARALESNNYLTAVGSTKGKTITVNLSATTNIHSEKEFKELVVKEAGQDLIRLGDIATVNLGAENYDVEVSFDGQNATFIGVNVLPTANALAVIDRVREVLPDIEKQLPEGLNMSVPYDATKYIEDAIFEVEKTLVQALLIVIVVIFLFLGSVRSILIPIVAMPLSLIGSGLFMFALGFSINLLTLLAMVLAIGLVVDDAIIVTENVHRNIEKGHSPFQAAIRGARELSTAIIAMTITLVSVYAPIGFMTGLTGSLFSEFAFTLAGAVLISGIIALTLSPMMCSKILKSADKNKRGGLASFLDRLFERLKNGYLKILRGCLNSLPAIVVFSLGVLVSCYFLFTMTKKELAPEEDKGVIFTSATAPPTAVIDQTGLYARELYNTLASFPETDHVFMITGGGGRGQVSIGNTAFAGMVFIPWSERERSQMDLQPLVQDKLDSIAGLDAAAFGRPALPGSSGGLPVQFVIRATEPPLDMKRVSDELLQKARESGLFVFTDTDMKYDLPRERIVIDREKAADLGVNMQELGNSLAVMLGGNYLNRFSIEGRSYKVIPQVTRQERLNPDQLKQYRIRSRSGEMIPLSTIVKLKKTVEPRQLNRFQQLNAATISAVPAPGVTMGRALDFFQQEAGKLFTKEFTADYAGQSRQYIQEGGELLISFFLALVVIYLVLAAQFESFRDPLIIMVSVPMSISGALIFLTLGFASINIYTQVGLITLIGLISKHGILIVEFANQLREQGRNKLEAVSESAGIRLRPILMTTFSTVMGVFPLLIASGPGAASRFNIGLVVTAGMLIGTFFTLFVLPPIYLLLSKTRRTGDLEAGSV
ncbi:MAG: efflux RND transporter permease subunit [Desulfobia sp.]